MRRRERGPRVPRELRGFSPRLRRALMPWLVTIVSGVLALGFLPLAWWIGCVFAAFRAWFYEGRWLYYADRDSAQLAAVSGPLPSWLEPVVPFVVLIGFVAGSVAAMNRWLRKRWWLWAAVGAFGLLWAGTLVLLGFDPGGILDWALD